VTAGCDYLAGNPAASGAGLVLRNNTIMNHRERGMILQADNGTIEGNVIEGSTLIGIFIGPESYWGSACYSRNITIRNNTISNVGYWAGSPGALVIAPNTQCTLPPAGAFENMVIDSNTFQNFNVTGIFVSSTSGVVISNNTFTNVQQAIPVAPDDKGEDVLPGSLVFITKSSSHE
jgi:parallel beta-helix repeat protein